jgi:hypothetical protein
MDEMRIDAVADSHRHIRGDQAGDRMRSARSGYGGVGAGAGARSPEI